MKENTVDLLSIAQKSNGKEQNEKEKLLHGLIKSQNWCKELEAVVKILVSIDFPPFTGRHILYFFEYPVEIRKVHKTAIVADIGNGSVFC